MLTAYLAADGFENQLAEELGGTVRQIHGRLFVAERDPVEAAWAVNTWFDVEEVEIVSVGEAVRILRERQRSWAPYAPDHGGRVGLIVEKLPPLSRRPLELGQAAPSSPLGSFTLLAPNRMLFAQRCSSPFPNGQPNLAELRQGPPNRAYRKLWEAMLLMGRFPRSGDLAVDLGASPGGWTWLLAELGCRVVAVDRAPLAPAVAARPGVSQVQRSAFGLDATALTGGETPQWVCSDVACYPERLNELLDTWQAAHPAPRMVVTVKFQGRTDHEVAQRLGERPGVRLVHLHHNKHELTMLVGGLSG